MIIVVAAIFVALATMGYLAGQGQPAAGTAIYLTFFVSIPLGCGFLIYRGLRLTRNYGDQKFGWLCVVVGTIVLTVYSLLFIALWSIDD